MRVDGSIMISAPVETVFDGWADLERAAEHQAPTKERRKLTDGPVGAGTRYAAVDRWPGRDVAFEMEITEYDRPSHLAAEWFEPMSGSWSADFVEASSGTTKMDFVATIEPGGFMALLAPLMRPWARRQLASGLVAFKDWVEAEA
ncbi:MAG: SRPBCC family protein [Nitriliruptorales bacterium]|nr:SRPBCC family protein [Nitriliruptorales bacterium]